MGKSMGCQKAHGRRKANDYQIVAYPESEAEVIGSCDYFFFFFCRGLALGTLVCQCELNVLEQEGWGNASERKTKEEATIAVCSCNVSKF